MEFNNNNNNNNSNLKIISKPMKKLINDSSIYNCDNNKLQTILRELKKREYQTKNRKTYLYNSFRNQLQYNQQQPQQQPQEQQLQPIQEKTSSLIINNININNFNDYIVPINNNGSTIYYKNNNNNNNNTPTHYYNKNNDYLKNIYSNENYNNLIIYNNNNNNNNTNNSNNNNNNYIKVNKTIVNSNNYNHSLVFLKSLPLVPYESKCKMNLSKNEDSVVPSLYKNESSLKNDSKSSISNGPLPSFHQIQTASFSSLELPPIVERN